MTWWGWIVAGAVLLGAELAFVDAQFYLVFVGSAALVVGILTIAVPSLAPWVQWALFALLGVVSLVAFRSRIYRLLRGHPPEVRTGPGGGVVTVPVALAPGETCQVEFRGSHWTVRNDGTVTIPADAHAHIIRLHDLTLSVRLDG